MNRRKLVLVAALVVAVVFASTLVIQAREGAAPPTGKNVAAVKSHPNFDSHPARQGGSKPSPRVPRASTLLFFDDGSYETGLGVTGVAGYDGQIGMRFGGAAATSGLVPMRLRGAYFRLFGGFYGAQSINLNFWHPLTPGGFPVGGAPLTVAPGPAPDPSTTQYAGLGAGPTIVTANASVLVGVGVLGNSSWFVAGDTNPPIANRHFFGAFTTQAWTYGPNTLNGFGFVEDFLIRLLVDGNVPVELESFTIE